MTNPEPVDERLQFVKHKGQMIYVIDFSHCSSKEMMVLLDLVRADISRHAPGRCLRLPISPGRTSIKTLRCT